MELFELVRLNAEYLRSELVKSGRSVSTPKALIESALEFMEIELFYLRDNDPALKGSIAVFDGQSGEIRCKKSLECNVKRFEVIAHEIGHARIHSKWPKQSNTKSDTIYSKYERRELQANTFAREFILPRSKVKDLYIDQAKTPCEIAELVGLDEKIVKEQIVDSMLIPDIKLQDSFSGKIITPNNSQRRAINHIGSSYLLNSGPGTGKTVALQNRVMFLVEEMNVDPSNILILTFSNRVARIIEQNLAFWCPDHTSKIFIGTIYSFGHELIRYFAKPLGFQKDPKVFDSITAAIQLQNFSDLDNNLYPELNRTDLIRKLIQSVYQAKGELVDKTSYESMANNFIDSASDNLDRKILEEKYLNFSKFYNHYESIKENFQMLDFGDQIIYPLNLFDKNQAYANKVRSRFQYILVDGFQDLNFACISLLTTLFKDSAKFWANGDTQQSIYGFRGGSSQNLLKFKEFFPDATIENSQESFRSSESILKICNNFSSWMNLPSELKLTNSAFTSNYIGNQAKIQKFRTQGDELCGIAKCIIEMHDKGVCYRNQLVLCRTNDQTNKITELLHSKEIPVLHLGNMFKDENVRNLIAIMSLSQNVVEEELTRAGCISRYSIPRSDSKLIFGKIKNFDKPLIAQSDLIDNICNEEMISKEGQNGIKCLICDLRQLAHIEDPWEFLENYVLYMSTYIKEFASSETVEKKIAAFSVWQFLKYVNKLKERVDVNSIESLLIRINSYAQYNMEPSHSFLPFQISNLDAVNVMTVHDSKGIECEFVYVTGFDSLHFPFKFNGRNKPPPVRPISIGLTDDVLQQAEINQVNDEKNICYVALSRGRSQLLISYSDFLENGKKAEPSPFLNQLGEIELVDLSGEQSQKDH